MIAAILMSTPPRIPVPVTFQDWWEVVYILAIAFLVPVVIAFSVGVFTAARKKGDQSRMHLIVKPSLAGATFGFLSVLLVGAVAITLYPYAYEREAFQEVQDYYGIQLSREGNRLPVKLFEDSGVESPVDATVYRALGGNPIRCEVHAMDYYVLMCGDSEEPIVTEEDRR